MEGVTARRSNLLGVLAGALLIANFLATGVSLLTGVRGFFPIITLTIGALAFLLSPKALSARLLPVVLLAMLYFVHAFGYIGTPAVLEFALAFGGVALPAMIVGVSPFSVDMASRTIFVASVLAVPILLILGQQEYSAYDSGSLMGLGYAVIPMFLVCSYVLVRRGSSAVSRVLAMLPVASLAFLFTRLVSRGVFLAVAVALVIITLRWLLRTSFQRLVPLGAALISSAIALILIWPQLSESPWYHSMFLSRADDILNGRGELWSEVFSVRDVPSVLAGSGVGSFELVTGEISPHNVLGHVYYELGLPLALVLVLWLVLVVVRVFRTPDESEVVLFIILIAASIVRLMVSYWFWIDIGFWFLLGYWFAHRDRAQPRGHCKVPKVGSERAD